MWIFYFPASHTIYSFIFNFMEKIFFFILIGVLSVLCVAAQTGAQSSSIDKNVVNEYFQNQQFDEAIAYLAPVLRGSDSSDVAALGYAGYAYYMNDDARAAYRCYQRIVGLDSNNVAALHYLVLIESGEDVDEAIGYAARLIELQPGRAGWWRIMGELSRRKNQPDTALVYFNQAYVLAPGDVKVIAGLAELLEDQKNFTRADSILDLALEKDSLNSNLLKLRVRSAYFAQDYVHAIIPGERVVQSGEPATQALNWLALSYYNLKQYPDCIRVCEHMLDLGLELEAVYYYEARAWAKLRHYQQSDSLLEICLSKAISKTAEWYYDALGENHESLAAYRQAVANYDTAFYLFKDPLVLYTCGRICETELHNTVLARQYYRRYLALGKPVSKQEKEAYAYVRRIWGKHK